MKYLIIILLTIFSFETFAKCLIINESKIEDVTGFTPAGIVEACPKDTDGKDVKNFLDITYQKNQTTACIDADDCYAKLENLCVVDMINYGRPIVANDFSEVYCVKPVYDAAKRAARLLAEQTAIDEEKAKEDKKKGDWTTFCLTAKIGIEQLVCEDKGFL